MEQHQPEFGWLVTYRPPEGSAEPATLELSASDINTALRRASATLRRAGGTLIACEPLCPHCSETLSTHTIACTPLSPRAYAGGPVCVGPGAEL